MIRENGTRALGSRARPGQVQITGALHGVGWKLVLGIEGGAQGNCYTANGVLPPLVYLPACLRLTLSPLLLLSLSFSRASPLSLSRVPLALSSSLVHHGSQFPFPTIATDIVTSSKAVGTHSRPLSSSLRSLSLPPVHTPPFSVLCSVFMRVEDSQRNTWGL